jgi:hypothetical protein
VRKAERIRQQPAGCSVWWRRGGRWRRRDAGRSPGPAVPAAAVPWIRRIWWCQRRRLWLSSGIVCIGCVGRVVCICRFVSSSLDWAGLRGESDNTINSPLFCISQPRHGLSIAGNACAFSRTGPSSYGRAAGATGEPHACSFQIFAHPDSNSLIHAIDGCVCRWISPTCSTRTRFCRSWTREQRLSDAFSRQPAVTSARW